MKRNHKIALTIVFVAVAVLVIWGVIAGLPEDKAKATPPSGPWTHQKQGISLPEFNQIAFDIWDLGGGWEDLGFWQVQRVFYGICQDLEAGENPLDVKNRLFFERDITANYAGMIQATNAYCPDQAQNVISGAL